MFITNNNNNNINIIDRKLSKSIILFKIKTDIIKNNNNNEIMIGQKMMN